MVLHLQDKQKEIVFCFTSAVPGSAAAKMIFAFMFFSYIFIAL